MVGAMVGSDVTGDSDGDVVGLRVVGDTEGEMDGDELVGADVGAELGADEASVLGLEVGRGAVGAQMFAMAARVLISAQAGLGSGHSMPSPMQPTLAKECPSMTAELAFDAK